MKDIERKHVRRYKRSESIVFRKTKDAFGGLSNMAAGYPIELGDINIATSEALYQALRYPDFPDIQKEILSITNPMKAKMHSRVYSHLTRRDWGRIRTSIMRLVLQIKYISNMDKFGALLLSTNELPIVEESYRDAFWGAKPIDREFLEGVNALGRLLMELREHIKSKNELLPIGIPPIPNLLLLGQPISAFMCHLTFSSNSEKRKIQVPLFETEAFPGKRGGDFMNQIKPYPRYKDSGVPWLGKVPEGWEIKPLKHWVRINQRNLSEETNPDFEFEYYDISSVGTGKLVEKPEVLTFKNAPSRARRLLRPGDTLFSTVRTYLKATFTYWKSQNPGIPAVASTGFAVLSPSPESLPGFASFLTQTEAFANYVAALSVGIAYPAISETTFGAIKVPVPPLPEQRAIVKFLDWAERRIRFIVAARKRRIQLLEEYRQALINDAVTGKFDVRTGKPYPSYKDSGVPWLGKVPEGWEIKPLKHWVRINQRNLSEETNPDFEFEYYDISSVGTGKLVEKPEVLTFKNAPSRARRLLRPGDTLFSTVRTYLKATFTYWKSQNPGIPAVASTGFAVLSPSPESLPGFASFLTQAEAFANYVAALSVGIAYPAISETTFGAIKVPVPPLPEQRAIAEYLDRETAKIDAAIEKTKESIALWEELCETLISDVVTGKLDVREAAERLPEEEPELEERVKALEASLFGGENETSEADSEPVLASAEETA